MRLAGIICLFASLAWFASDGIQPARAEPLACPDPLVRVEARKAETRAAICEAVSAARDAVEVCGLAQRVSLDIETVETLVLPMGPGLAAFDSSDSRIRIIRPKLLRDRLTAEDTYAELPDDVVFRSLLVHETAHALLDQALAGRKIPIIDHEYVANALELAAMDPASRAVLLDAAGVRTPVSRDVIDIFIYAIAPRKFAALSFLHYEANGCAPITGILDGTFSFRVPR